MTIYLITKNEGKIRELSRQLNELAIVKMLETPDIKELETGSVLMVSQDKARKAASFVRHTKEVEYILADDTGLYIEGEYPGVRIGRETKLFFNGDFKGWMEKYAGHSAIALTVLTLLYLPTMEMQSFEGRVAGTIAYPEQYYSNGGFGFDPIFVCNDWNKTLAQLDNEGKKDLYSPRGRAIQQLKSHIEKLNQS